VTLPGSRTLLASFRSDTLLKGVLYFILFAGSINVKARTLGEVIWVVLALSIGVAS
jgi:NhaP-type Na+/H+ or K+/H+ antiporter